MSRHGIMRKRSGRLVLASMAVMALGLAIGAAPSMASEDHQWICHATDSDTNPYRIINPAVDSAKWEGHLSHATSGHPGMKTWKDAGSFGGVSHLAGGDKLDIFGVVNAPAPPAACFSTTPDTTLKLVKELGGDPQGPAKTTDWELFATGETTISGDGGFDSTSVPAGAYTLSESDGPDNYTPGQWSCTGAEDLNRSAVANSSVVTLAKGDAVTCTIINTYVQPRMASLTLVKAVTPVNAPDSPSAWTLSAAGNTPVSHVSPVTSAVLPGTYTLNESGPTTNYASQGWVCTPVVNSGASVTLAAGQSTTCTITNLYTAPLPTTATLNLVKVVDNALGGGAEASAWTLTASGSTSFSGAGRASSAVPPGTYTLSESTGPTGYTPSVWACTPVANSGATVTLAAGQVTTCTITNTFVPTIVPPVVTPVTPVVTPVTPVVTGETVTAPVVIAPVKVVKGAVVTTAPAKVTALAFTGAETVPLGLSGLLTLLLGAGLVATARRQGRRANN